MVTPEEIRAASNRIAGQIVRTPCSPALGTADLVPCHVRYKFENLQRTGSFKDRGAANRLALLTESERARGVITASAGNHAQALALHATRAGVSATVVMPETTPLVKVANTRRYGADVVLHGTSFYDAVDEAERRVAEQGLLLVPAFDDDAIIAGQGSTGLELLEQVPDLDLVVVPIGGGGLISGIAVALKDARPEVRIVGVEAEAAPSARAARDRGAIVDLPPAETIADGIAVKRVGERTFPIIREHVEDVVVVSDEEIASAILLLLEQERTVVEGAGAAPLAALLAGRVPVSASETAVVVLSGGNIDVNMVARIIERGLVFDGRSARLMVKVRDRPGSLARLTDAVAKLGANVLDIGHRRSYADISVGDVEIVMHLETRGREHVQDVVRALEARGHRVEEDV